MTWQAKWAKSLSGFKEARRILEIGSGAFETSIALARQFPEKEIYGVDFVLSPLAMDNLKGAPENLTVIKHDARDLQLFSSGYFDFIFSVAVMEHIRELELHLKETDRILSRSGVYWFWQAPFWSCSRGHHYQHGSKSCPIPPYTHLHMERDELVEHLVSNGMSAERARSIAVYIYDRGDLSRLSRTETRRIIEASPFQIDCWEDQEDDQYDEAGARRVLGRNIYNVSAEDLLYKGAKVRLSAKKHRAP